MKSRTKAEFQDAVNEASQKISKRVDELKIDKPVMMCSLTNILVANALSQGASKEWLLSRVAGFWDEVQENLAAGLMTLTDTDSARVILDMEAETSDEQLD